MVSYKQIQYVGKYVADVIATYLRAARSSHLKKIVEL